MSVFVYGVQVSETVHKQDGASLFASTGVLQLLCSTDSYDMAAYCGINALGADVSGVMISDARETELIIKNIAVCRDKKVCHAWFACRSRLRSCAAHFFGVGSTCV